MDFFFQKMSLNVQKETNKKPNATQVLPNAIQIAWRPSEKKDGEEVECYEIKYKNIEDKKWQSMKTETARNTALVSGLQNCSSYEFKVRPCYLDDEGPFSEVSNPIKTTISPAREILNKCQKTTDGNPSIYKIAVKQTFLNKTHRFRKCTIDLATKERTEKEKTIMLVGATGAGKSTLLDGMMNFICGVSMTDEFRFTVVDLMDDEKPRTGDKTQSLTDWITCYSIENINPHSLGFKLNIIDTPGFGDTRGIERDNQLVKQIKEFFSIGGSKGVDELNAVCLVSQAPLARLTQTQHYIADSILSVFGKDIANTFVNMITFADGKTPPVVEALKKSDVPSDIWFPFNNSALFSQCETTHCASFQNLFWEMGNQSYETFFKKLRSMEPISLTLTKEVLREREQLQATLEGLRQQVDMGLTQREEKRKIQKFVKDHEAEIERGKNFEIRTNVWVDKRVDLEPGEIITVCDYCHFTCHYPCGLMHDKDKYYCAAMNNGKCTVCPNKCRWDIHYNKGYKFEKVLTEKLTTSDELKEEYDKGQKGKKEKDSLLQGLKRELYSLTQNVLKRIKEIKASLTKLSTIALKPDPLNSVEYIELLIKSEEQQMKPGFQDRIKSLNAVLKQAKMATEIMNESFKFEFEEED